MIDALAVADEAGMGSRINTVMQPCFFKLAGILPPDEAIARIKAFVEKTYAKRGEAVVARNFAAIDRSLERLGHVTLGEVTERASRPPPPVPDDVPDFVARITVAPDGRRRRPAAGERAAGRRHVPDRHGDSTRSGRSPRRSRSGIRPSASTAASARWSARTPRSG